jgi:hypothetical protein
LSINKIKESLVRWADEVGYNYISCSAQFWILEMHLYLFVVLLM